MSNTELYINGQLIDAGGDLGVRLNRKLIDPAALNTVDAQYSFSISLPPSGINNAAFNYANVEETRNKFNRVYSAELIVNGMRIFNGLFRLTNVNSAGYKGNLYIPAPKTIKDIFGDLKLNQNVAYDIEFLDFATYVNAYNAAAANGPQPAIFPYILYGVIPKVPLNRDTNVYSARNIWDSTARIGITDLAPAINPLIMLKHIFASKGYDLQGTAFQDRKLTELYQSYKNASDYVQPWNYGRHAKIHLTGSWSNWTNTRDSTPQLEKGAYLTSDYVTDLFDALNTRIVIAQDPGGNVLYSETPDDGGSVWVNCQVRIPTAGFYKVELNASIHVDVSGLLPQDDPNTGIKYISGASALARADMTNNLFELRLCRDNRQGDFNLSSAHTDGIFYEDNQPQNTTFDADNVPKYFPQLDANGQVNLIDRAEDENVVLGFMFGQVPPKYVNPKDAGNKWAQVYAAKPALSWDNSVNDAGATRLAIKSPGFWKYGVIGDFDSPGDNPDMDIDYSAGTRINDKALDGAGNPGAAEVGDVILSRFPIQKYYTYTISAPGATGIVYVHDGPTNTAPIFSATLVSGVATFDTNFPDIITVDPRFTMLLKSPTFDVTATMIINRAIDSSTSDVIGWELTNKYKIDLNGAPTNFAKRGFYGGASADDWNNAQGSANAVVWFEAGELVTLATVSQQGRWQGFGAHSTAGFVRQNVLFDLSIQPFRTDKEWLKVNFAGNGTAVMSWADPVNFDVDTINLVGFLDADVKTDDYIDNFCKAFNLTLSQVDAQTFSLDLKQSKTATSNLYVNLDGVMSVKDRDNVPLGLPSRYVLGFTIDKEEEGYVETGEDGGGTFDTGATEENIVTQTSTFSYNWYKAITKTETGGDITINLPIISKAEAWALSMSYPDAMQKRYTDLAMRFMYYNGILPGTYAYNGASLHMAAVRNDLAGLNILNYKNALYTILYNFFTILISGASHYTTGKAYLSAVQYSQLDGSLSVMFNGDLYYIAELAGYDPLNRNQTTIKLIRKI